MATARTLDTAVAALIVGYGATRLASNLRTDIAIPAAGSTGFQLVIEHVAADERNSNTVYKAVDVVVRFVHKLAAVTLTGELAAWLDTLCPTFVAPLLLSSTWRGLTTTVQEVLEGPEIDKSVERVGNVLVCSIKARIALKI